MPRLNAQGTYELREERLLSEYLARHFPKDQIIKRVRLGAPAPSPGGRPLEPEEVKLLKSLGRWADALIIRPTDLILVEAEVLPTPGVISTLQLYGRLLAIDPEFSEYHHLPVRLMVVWAYNEPVLAQLARDQGLEVRIFSPTWVAQALAARFPDRPSLHRPTPTPPLKR